MKTSQLIGTRDPRTPEQHVEKQRHLREVDDKMSAFFFTIRKNDFSQPGLEKPMGNPFHGKESISFLHCELGFGTWQQTLQVIE